MRKGVRILRISLLLMSALSVLAQQTGGDGIAWKWDNGMIVTEVPERPENLEEFEDDLPF